MFIKVIQNKEIIFVNINHIVCAIPGKDKNDNSFLKLELSTYQEGRIGMEFLGQSLSIQPRTMEIYQKNNPEAYSKLTTLITEF